ncbi:hypothetical protein GWR56_08270 [Mucilaginibacter sp. 14171R-50]|uniref:hypothetical protein n=1 Tax=Mucilaginibacter sp. 14171R-50 TaxID=2703789 RepID=UPI00138DA375|nr:hypothetical protein [Mucilaginibacter sp. 14171R-50]QHS55535.1 hypothetical protein GWR56_08270 [Mucilaginibacter sp. 14171R-50]
MSFANGTLITTPNGTTAIEQLKIGYTVSAWTPTGVIPKAVVHSLGETDLPSLTLMQLSFNDVTLLVTLDQPVVLADNSIKKAGQLNPVTDHLMGTNGQPVKLTSLNMGMYNLGIHSIIIDTPAKSGQHRIIANGIVCGDYLMEIMPSTDKDYD